jgi:hypothetical protein
MIWTAPSDKDTGKTALKPRTQNLHRTRDLLLPLLLSGQVNLETNQLTG